MKKLRDYGILLLVSLLLFGVSFSEILDNTDDIDTIYEFFPGPPRFHFEVRNIYERFSLIVLILSIITLLKFVFKEKNNNSKNINADNLKLKKRYILLIIFAFVSLLGLLGYLFRWSCPYGWCYGWVPVVHSVLWLIFLIFLLLFLIFLIICLIKNTNKKLLLLYILLLVLNLFSFIFGFIYFK